MATKVLGILTQRWTIEMATKVLGIEMDYRDGYQGTRDRDGL